MTIKSSKYWKTYQTPSAWIHHSNVSNSIEYLGSRNGSIGSTYNMRIPFDGLQETISGVNQDQAVGRLYGTSQKSTHDWFLQLYTYKNIYLYNLKVLGKVKYVQPSSLQTY